MSVSVKPLPKLRKRQLTTKQLQQPNSRLGSLGEQRAAIFLRQLGWQILASNVSDGRHEVDLVALDPVNDEVVLVEVKTRGNFEDQLVYRSVGYRKQFALAKIGQRFVTEHRLPQPWRIDLLIVRGEEIEHLENISAP